MSAENIKKSKQRSNLHNLTLGEWSLKNEKIIMEYQRKIKQYDDSRRERNYT
jgi:hypothetical protein